MWAVTVYRDNGYSEENYSKHFKEEENALSFFSDEIKYEFEEEIDMGVVADQEVQNIINQGIYIYESDTYEVTISLEFVGEGVEDEDII